MTNQNDNPADQRARRIAEAKARAEAAKQARAGGGTPPAAASVPAQPPATATPVPAEAPEVVAASAAPAASAEDERARRIAEARARAEAAKSGRAGGTAPAAPSTSPAAPAQPVAQAATPTVAASATVPAGETAGASSDDRAARIAAARARAQQAATAKGGGAPAPAPTPAAAPASGSTFAVTPAPAAPVAAAPVPAAAQPAPAVTAAIPAAAPVVARTLPTGAEEWRAPRNAGSRMVTARPDPGALAARELSRHEVQNLVTRRSMIRTSFWAGLGVTVAGLLLGFVNFFWPRKVTGFGSLVTVPATVVPQPGGDPVRIPEAKAWLVNLKPGDGVPQQFTGTAQPSKEGGLLALYQKCPHLGCTVPWRGEFDFEGVKGWFRCPCHGSTYTKGGVRVFGPAPRSMDTFLLKANSDGSVVIDTRAQSIKLGGLDDPQRAITLG